MGVQTLTYSTTQRAKEQSAKRLRVLRGVLEQRNASQHASRTTGSVAAAGADESKKATEASKK